MNTLITEILGPIARRAGTATGAFLVGVGASTEHVPMIVAGVSAAILVLAEVGISRLTRKAR